MSDPEGDLHHVIPPGWRTVYRTDLAELRGKLVALHDKLTPGSEEAFAVSEKIKSIDRELGMLGSDHH